MICPLIVYTSYRGTYGEKESNGECRQSECAWWVKPIEIKGAKLDTEGCAIKKIAERIL